MIPSAEPAFPEIFPQFSFDRIGSEPCSWFDPFALRNSLHNNCQTISARLTVRSGKAALKNHWAAQFEKSPGIFLSLQFCFFQSSYS
jgi:hypothetical protein